MGEPPWDIGSSQNKFSFPPNILSWETFWPFFHDGGIATSVLKFIDASLKTLTPAEFDARHFT